MSAKQLSTTEQPSCAAMAWIAAQGGRIAGNTRREIEAQTCKKIVSRLTAKQMLAAKNAEHIEASEEEK